VAGDADGSECAFAHGDGVDLHLGARPGRRLRVLVKDCRAVVAGVAVFRYVPEKRMSPLSVKRIPIGSRRLARALVGLGAEEFSWESSQALVADGRLVQARVPVGFAAHLVPP